MDCAAAATLNRHAVPSLCLSSCAVHLHNLTETLVDTEAAVAATLPVCSHAAAHRQ